MSVDSPALAVLIVVVRSARFRAQRQEFGWFGCTPKNKQTKHWPPGEILSSQH